MKRSNAFKVALSAVVLGLLASGTAPISVFAATTVTATMAVSATVQSTCIVSTTALGFGTYISTGVSNATSTITVTCTSTTPYTLGLDPGVTSGATVTTRQMKSGAGLLNYALFSDSPRTINWGNTIGSWVAGTGTGVAQVLTVYGQVAASQYVLPGVYGDTITATITY